jgi:putative ABC transport system permease protein
MSRQRRVLARTVVLVALTVCFAASTAVFNATYRQQAEVDALLTNGADVTVTESPGVEVGPDSATALERVPGVAAVEPVQHRFAYVGSDLQDLYGVRTDTIVDATRLQDAYFEGGSAQELMARLGRDPAAVLVSLETVHDFQLTPGDPVTLRLQDGRTKEYTEVGFHYVGVAKEFPTAPSDSFVVANADYVAQQTGSDAVGSFLVTTDGASPPTVARAVQTVAGPGAHVTDVTTSRRVVGSSLTAVDLQGLTRVELGFALVLAAAATGLVLALGLAERRRTFAIAAALGAKPGQLGGFVWTEAAFVTVAGLVAGAAGGWLLSQMLVKVLTGVFDPPPSALAVPWAYLAVVGGVAVVAIALAAHRTVRSTQAPDATMVRGL